MLYSRFTKFFCHIFTCYGLFAMSLTFAAEEIPTSSFIISEFSIIGENPISSEETRQVLEPFLGEHQGIEGLLEAASEFETAILNAGFSFNRVLLPPQTLEAGIVELKVIQIQLANIVVEGNEHFTDENIRNSIPGLIVDTTPDTKLLAMQLIVANKHPSKRIAVRMKQSEEEADSVDAIVNVKDQRPWQIFSSLNNIGTSKTGRLRFAAGGQHNNLMGYDDSFTASYTTSPGNTSDVKQWGLNYSIPAYPLSGKFNFFYSRSDVDSGTIQSVFDVSGAGKFYGASYTQTFQNRKNYRHSMSIGVEDKSFDNNVIFNGANTGTDVKSRPVTLSYFGEIQMEKSQLSFNISHVRNLNGGELNNNAAYTASRTGAKQDWDVVRYSASYNRSLNKNWMLKLAMKGQWSNERLISGEQFGVGGSNSVRGFEERAVSGDRGNQATVQFFRPLFKKKVLGRLYTDIGHVKTISPTSGQVGSQTIMSAGIGASWKINDNFNLSVDYAHELNEGRSTDIAGTKTHASLFYRF
jgi:hemolysin activation/secretion protein